MRLVRELPAAEAAALHRRQGRGAIGIVALGVALAAPAVLLRAQWLVLLAVVGAGVAALGVVLAARWLRRERPPRYEVTVADDAVAGCWAGTSPTRLAWRDVRRVVVDAAGCTVVGRGRVVIVPRALPDHALVVARIRDLADAAPPPLVRTELDLDRLRVPVAPERVDTVRWLQLGARIGGWLAVVGTLSCVACAFAGFAGPIVLLAGVATLGAGAYLGLGAGLATLLLDVVQVHSVPLVRTVYRGWPARVIGVTFAVVGLLLGALGSLVLLAGVLALR